MSAEMLARKNADAAAYRSIHTLLDAVSDTVAGGEAEIAFAGDYILSVEGNFDTAAATVNTFVKRATESDFKPLVDLGTALTGQFIAEGDVSVLCGKGDIFYAQLSGITSTPAVSVKLAFVKN